MTRPNDLSRSDRISGATSPPDILALSGGLQPLFPSMLCYLNRSKFPHFAILSVLNLIVSSFSLPCPPLFPAQGTQTRLCHATPRLRIDTVLSEHDSLLAFIDDPL